MEAVHVDHVRSYRSSGQLRAAQRGAHAAPKLADGEGLRNVVVRSELEAYDLVELVVAGGQHDDRHGAPRTQPATDLEAVELGQHDVEDDEVDVVLIETGKRLLAVTGLHDPEPLALERKGEQLLHRFLVVDEQNGRVLSHQDKG
jgi:hypothetical protein